MVNVYVCCARIVFLILKRGGSTLKKPKVRKNHTKRMKTKTKTEQTTQEKDP